MLQYWNNILCSNISIRINNFAHKMCTPEPIMFVMNCGGTVLLPKLILLRDIKDRPYRVTGYETIELEIENSDRKSTVMNFALLSTLLYSMTPGLPIFDDLRKLSHSGCGPGCFMSWHGCENENCKEKPRLTSSCFHSIDIRRFEIGFWVFDQLCTFSSARKFQWIRISFEFIHSMSHTFLKHHYLSILEFQIAFRTYGRNFKTGLADILGEFENKILGSAVLVSMHPINRLSLPCAERSSLWQAAFSHVSNSVLLCDLIIDERKDHLIRYPYMGWYCPKSIQNLRKYHFHGSTIPPIIRHIPTSAALLWRRERIGCNDIVLDSSQ